MKISTKGKYGLKAMYFLAKETTLSNNIITLKVLSKATEVPEPYLEKILGTLRKKELVSTIRGVLGGYKLTKTPDQITIGEILRSLENNLYITSCNYGACKKNNCPSKNLFNFIYEEINSVLDKVTLKDMIDKN